jgi:hypothetical protein
MFAAQQAWRKLSGVRDRPRDPSESTKLKYKSGEVVVAMNVRWTRWLTALVFGASLGRPRGKSTVRLVGAIFTANL